MRPLLLSSLLLSASSLAFVIFPEAFLPQTPALHIEPDHELPVTHPKDTESGFRRKCLEKESPTGLGSERSSLLRPLRPEIEPARADGEDDDLPIPVIVWHGLGDSSSSDGMKSIAELLDLVHPGTFVYLVSLGYGANDKRNSFFGKVTDQIEEICEHVGKNRILQTAPAVDLLGFSQGGQFLRGLVETCDKMPKVRTLLTYGSQHNGIAKFQQCKDAGDWVCRAAETLVNTGGVFTSLVQDRVVPAQYFRDPANLDAYLEGSKWLADVNNERKEKNKTYGKRLAEVDQFVMVLFGDDETVVPKESSWFAEVNAETKEVTELRNRTIYEEDWIGLKELDEKKGLVFAKVEGKHMHLKAKGLKQMFKNYFGPMNKTTTAWEVEDEEYGQPSPEAVQRWILDL